MDKLAPSKRKKPKVEPYSTLAALPGGRFSPVQVACLRCDWTFESKAYPETCPACDSSSLKITVLERN